MIAKKHIPHCSISNSLVRKLMDHSVPEMWGDELFCRRRMESEVYSAPIYANNISNSHHLVQPVPHLRKHKWWSARNKVNFQVRCSFLLFAGIKALYHRRVKTTIKGNNLLKKVVQLRQDIIQISYFLPLWLMFYFACGFNFSLS